MQGSEISLRLSLHFCLLLCHPILAVVLLWQIWYEHLFVLSLSQNTVLSSEWEISVIFTIFWRIKSANLNGVVFYIEVLNWWDVLVDINYFCINQADWDFLDSRRLLTIDDTPITVWPVFIFISHFGICLRPNGDVTFWNRPILNTAPHWVSHMARMRLFTLFAVLVLESRIEMHFGERIRRVIGAPSIFPLI